MSKMVEQAATVVEADADMVCVETTPESSCSHCSSTGCSGSVLAELFSPKTSRMYLQNSIGVVKGQRVVIGIPDKFLLAASFRAYLMPLLVMLGVTAVASFSGASEAVQGLLALAGLYGGFLWVKRQMKTSWSREKLQPQLLGIADPCVDQDFVKIDMNKLLRSE